MGYTHHWSRSRPAAKQEWAEYLGDIARIVEYCTGEGIPLADAFGEEGSFPLCTADRVAFNGAGDEAHETFLMHRGMAPDGGCKTAYKPYDIAVCLALIMAKKRFGPGIEVSSDGSAVEWKEAFEVAAQVFSVDAKFSMTYDPNTKVSQATLEVK